MLLEKCEFQDNNDKKGKALSVNNLGQVVWEEVKPKRFISSIHSWTSAFLCYTSVYVGAHPHRAQELLKYAHIVRTAATRFGGWGWCNYDVQFRMRQQSQPQRSWAVIDGELWALCVSTSLQRSLPNKTFQSTGYQPGGFRTPSQGDSRFSYSRPFTQTKRPGTFRSVPIVK